MRFIIIILVNLFFLSVSAEELVITSNGKRLINESININDNITRTLIKNEFIFTDNIGNYGMTTCLGTLEKKSKKIQFNLKRESLNKKNEIYWTKFYREKEEQDAGAGTLEFISGEGFYKNLIGKKCNYAIKYFRSDVFFFNKFVNYKL